MGKALGFCCTLVATLAFGVACTVHQTTEPALTGPSELAQTLRVSASPDSISQDGTSKATITVFAIDQNGRAKSGVTIRLDMAIGGVTQDFGTLSARTVVTGTDGNATAVFTAPAPPPVSSGGTTTRVSIVATPIGSNFDTALPQSVDIRLVPPGVILPPADTPTANFNFSPTQPTAAQAVLFDGSSSCAGSTACSNTTGITSFAWTFGDGGAATGVSPSHTFALAGTFNVTLTVINDRGVAASKTQTVLIGASVPPAGDFIFSPAAPNVGDTVLFNADSVRAAPGHAITQFNWNFGEPNSASNTATGVQATHAFGAAGTFTVVLSVLDDAGQKTVFSKLVVIGGGAPTAVLTVTKTGGNSVFADGSASTATTPATITSYTFIWGDGNTDVVPVASGSSKPHTYVAVGTYTVTLRVTDSLGRVGSTTQNVTVP
jgi:PKD repeat protein